GTQKFPENSFAESRHLWVQSIQDALKSSNDFESDFFLLLKGFVCQSLAKVLNTLLQLLDHQSADCCWN
ncbi:MAG: hypothetical protein VW995_18540, partial [Deltaproteobacteria bacterium]